MKTLLLAAFLGAPALAQDIATRIPPGSRVELRTRGQIVSAVHGKLVALDSSHVTVALRKTGTAVTLPWTNVENLRWTRGRSHARGLLEGALLGSILGAAVYFNGQATVANTPPTSDQIRELRKAGIAVALVLTGVGFAIGASSWNGAPIPRSSVGTIALAFGPNDEIRVESMRGRIVGRNAVAADSLRFVTRNEPIAIAWRNVGNLEVRAGRNRVTGVLFGIGVAYALTSIVDGFTDGGSRAYLPNVAVGAVAGYRYLSPTGWTSLPQPSP